MRATGFSFPCPPPTSSNDEAFERFIRTVKREPWKIHNPWPLIAGLKTYRQARTQPLIMTRYLPSSVPGDYKSSLEKELTHLHEVFHDMNDYTPAKLLARLLLSQAYEKVWSLLRGRIWDSEMEKRWVELNKIKTHLSNVCGAITLSEELLATATSILACTYEYWEEQEVVRQKEKEIVAHHTNLSRYLQAFKKVMLLASQQEEYRLILTYLGLYLQGIQECRSQKGILVNYAGKHKFFVVDSDKRCRILAEWVNAMSSGKDLHTWLLHALFQSYEELNAFVIAASTLKYEKGLNEENKYLWILMEGGAEHEIVADGTKLSYNPLRAYVPRRASAILHPH